MDGLGNGPVQMGVVGLEGLVAVAAATGVEKTGDAIEIGLVRSTGSERGDGRLDGKPGLHDLEWAGVGRRTIELLGGNLSQEGAAANVAGDEPVAF